MTIPKKFNFVPLRKVMDKIDDNGEFGRCGNWELRLGGYDMGYEIYYRGEPVGRVDYGDKEYELYDEDFMTKDQIPEFLAAIDAKRFKDVGYHEQDDEFTDEEQEMINETRKQVMWAIDFRDMHSAIHGLYYAKDRKLVEEFYEALKSVLDERNPEYADDPGLREMDYQTIWDEFYSRGMQEIDEIDFRDIGRLPSGKYGIVIDDVEYRLVNNVAIDIYEESTGK